MTTPYDGQVGIWHWKGDSLPADSIEDAVRTLRQFAPHVSMLLLKTTDGSDWMARFDKKNALAISGPTSITQWVQVLEANNMTFHAWCVPKGENIEAEADLIIETANTPGVKSLILDIEPYAGFWRAGRDPIRPFMTRIRRGIGGRVHLGMAMDPRRHHYNSIYPAEWRPFINSLHPMVYWGTFQRPIAEVMDEAWQVWGDEGLPIYPILQAYNVEADEIERARRYVIEQKGATAITYWRYGVIDANEFEVINQPMTGTPPPDGGTPPDPDESRYGDEIVVQPDDPRFTTGKHNPEAAFQTFRGTWGWPVKYIDTQRSRSRVWARWVPQIARSGFYEVSVFSPARHATTENARYKLHGVKDADGEIVIPVAQAEYFNLWVPLGIYEFDANNPHAGIIFLNDLTGESGKTIAFDAVRYRELIGDPADHRYLTDGFDPPIGTQTQRESDEVWPGYWIDVTGYAVRYFKGTPAEAYHTGADLNLNRPYFDADKDAPVYACADGTVIFSNRLPGWGWIINIRHDPLISTGEVMYSRYAHVNDARVAVGDRVVRGQQIAKVGNADGTFAYHLHFDLVKSDVLERSPGDWPKLNLNRVLANYVDPQDFIAAHRPPR